MTPDPSVLRRELLHLYAAEQLERMTDEAALAAHAEFEARRAEAIRLGYP